MIEQKVICLECNMVTILKVIGKECCEEMVLCRKNVN